MRVNHLTALLLPLVATATIGCRETCSDDELRYGDRCVLRPDASTFGDEDASAIEEDGGESVDEMDGTAPAPEEDGSVLSLGGPDDASSGGSETDTEPSLCPNASSCHRKVVQFAYGAPGCAILDDGTLWCWGGAAGSRVPQQVGTASTWQVVSSSDNFRDTALGAYSPGNHTCAINAGAMYCWGENYSGQLGIGSDSDTLSREPRRVGEAADWTSVSTSAPVLGGAVTCGVRAGALYCWGADGRWTPTRVGSRNDWSSVSATPLGGCGISGGALRCWGANWESSEKLVSESTDWTVVSASLNSACGIRQGKLFCWGTNEFGQLGLGVSALGASVDVPMQVGTSADWSAVDCALSRTCGIRGGELYCWGALSYQATDAAIVASTNASPKRIGEETGWIAVDVGVYGACGSKADGQLKCWGSNGNGELGTTRIPSRVMREPTQVGLSSDWTQIAAGAASTCGIQGGQLICWGAQRFAQTSDAPAVISQTFLPARLGSTSDWTDIAMHFAAEHACGVRGSSSIWCWGAASEGELGTAIGTSSTQPLKVPSVSSLAGVAVGPHSSCGRDREGLLCWGRGWSGVHRVAESDELKGRPWDMITTSMGIKQGRLAEWTPTTPAAHSTTSSEADWTRIASSTNHSCGIRRGALYCWGDNALGQLGLGIGKVNIASTWPEQIPIASGWTSVAVREGATCGLQADKTLWCWGRSFLGNPENAAPISPHPEQILGQWEALAMGGEHTCAISSDGSLWCWGSNQEGQLGLGEFWTSDPQAVEFIR